jgi:hypothetical protein
MMKVDAYKSDDGQLESDPMRAKARDIAHVFEQLAKQKAIGTSSAGTSKIDWHAAMELLNNIDTLMPHLKEWDDLRRPQPPSDG